MVTPTLGTPAAGPHQSTDSDGGSALRGRHRSRPAEAGAATRWATSGQPMSVTRQTLARMLANTRDCPANVLDHIDCRCAGDDACVLVAEHGRR